MMHSELQRYMELCERMERFLVLSSTGHLLLGMFDFGKHVIGLCLSMV